MEFYAKFQPCMDWWNAPEMNDHNHLHVLVGIISTAAIDNINYAEVTFTM